MIFFAIITRHFHLKIYSRVSKKTIYSRKASDLSWWWTYFVNLQTEPPRGSLFVGISNSGCRTSCLPWVTYSRASPRLYLGVIFVSNCLRVAHKWLYGVTYIRALPRLYLGVIFVSNYLKVAHYVLIRCFFEPSLTEASWWCSLCLLSFYISIFSTLNRRVLIKTWLQSIYIAFIVRIA